MAKVRGKISCIKIRGSMTTIKRIGKLTDPFNEAVIGEMEIGNSFYIYESEGVGK